MRKLLILTKRQITDDGPYLVGTLAASVMFLAVVAVFAFVYPKNLFPNMVGLLLVLPWVLGTCFYLVGELQMQADKHAGVDNLLSALPITGVQVIVARVLSGILIGLVVVACLGAALAGAIITDFIEWPDTLFPEGIFPQVI